MKGGTLYLIPVPLGPSGAETVLASPVLEKVRQLEYFIVENAKSARGFLKGVGTSCPLQELHMAELNEHTPGDTLETLLEPLVRGIDVGLLSEAGCPAVADPGADLVALAQQKEIKVVPMVGPSSILLALMASGLNGQRFAFHGYLPAKDAERQKALRDLEAESRKRSQTQIFIETPYRNRQMLDGILRACQGATRVCVATELSLPGESVVTRSVAAWKKQELPDIERRPTVFLLLA